MFLKLIDADNNLALVIIMRDAGCALITRCDTQELLGTLLQSVQGMRVSKVIAMPWFPNIDFHAQGFAYTETQILEKTL